MVPANTGNTTRDNLVADLTGPHLGHPARRAPRIRINTHSGLVDYTDPQIAPGPMNGLLQGDA